MPLLSVRPDDLAAAASALRGVADRLAESTDRFSAVAAGCAPQLGRDAAEIAARVAAQGRAAAAVVGADVRTAASGLLVVARAYADADQRLLGGPR